MAADDPADIEVPPPPSEFPRQDVRATNEAREIANLDQIEEAKKRAKRRLHSVLGWCVPASVVVGFGLFWLGAVIYVIHVVLPVEVRWLASSEIKELHTILFSGAVGAVVAQGVKRYLE